jgi:hypothetical protein
MRVARRAAEQRMKDRVAIEARQAAPNEPRLPVDERANAAIADQAKIECAHTASLSLKLLATPQSQSTNSRTPAAR